MPDDAGRDAAFYDHENEPRRHVADWGGDELFTRMPRRRQVHAGRRASAARPRSTRSTAPRHPRTAAGRSTAEHRATAGRTSPSRRSVTRRAPRA